MNPAPSIRSMRSLVRWHRRLETGLEHLDHQHRELFDTLTQLAGDLAGGTSKDQQDEALACMARHLIKHCQTEETLMREAGFPDRTAHANQHQDLVLRVRDLQYRWAKGQERALEEVARVGEWLSHHICESDLAMVSHLRAIPAS